MTDRSVKKQTIKAAIKNKTYRYSDDIALRYAAAIEDVISVKLCLKHGCDPNSMGGTPLLNALDNGNVVIAKILIEAGAQVIASESESLSAFDMSFVSPIELAIDINDLSLVKLMISNGATFDRSDFSWWAHDTQYSGMKEYLESILILTEV